MRARPISRFIAGPAAAFDDAYLDPVGARSILARVLANLRTIGQAMFVYANNNRDRLPNGNTLITEGAGGRVFEVTSDRQIVWEFMNAPQTAAARTPGTIYRAYRVPYAWLSQLPRPQEKAVTPPANGEFRVP